MEKQYIANVSLVLGFLDALLAYSCDENGDALDKRYNIGSNLSRELRMESVSICAEFQEIASELISGRDFYVVGKDLWLSRSPFPYGFPVDEYPANSETLIVLAREIEGFSSVLISNNLIFPVAP
jgi:hypothetical protein